VTSLRSAAAAAAARLHAAGLGLDDARRDAVLLARTALGWDAAAWLVRQHDPAPAAFSDRFESMLARRVLREPMAHIIGEREFYGRTFIVSPDVLVPRPETEFVVEAALAGQAPGTVVDIGTGSGCLAVTLALEWAGARIVATDISESALRMAHRNAERHGVAQRIEFRPGALLAGFSGIADLIVSNPP
jgi:release factor glutamine methyltransferase